MILPARNEHSPHAEASRHPLCDAAENALHSSPYRELRSLRCEVHADTLVLSGALSSYYLKQQAQETVRQLAGAARVENRVHVN